MTLTTRVAIGGNRPVNARELFEHCQGLVNTPEGVEASAWADGIGEDRGGRVLANPIGVGADALMWVEYGADGPLSHRCGQYCDEDGHDERSDADIAADPRQNGTSSAVVAFDVPYGARGGCATITEGLVAQVGAWCDVRGLSWQWNHDWNDEWVPGIVEHER